MYAIGQQPARGSRRPRMSLPPEPKRTVLEDELARLQTPARRIRQPLRRSADRARRGALASCRSFRIRRRARRSAGHAAQHALGDPARAARRCRPAGAAGWRSSSGRLRRADLRASSRRSTRRSSITSTATSSRSARRPRRSSTTIATLRQQVEQLVHVPLGADAVPPAHHAVRQLEGLRVRQRWRGGRHEDVQQDLHSFNRSLQRALRPRRSRGCRTSC